MLGGNLGSLLYGDVSVMVSLSEYTLVRGNIKQTGSSLVLRGKTFLLCLAVVCMFMSSVLYRLEILFSQTQVELII